MVGRTLAFSLTHAIGLWAGGQSLELALDEGIRRYWNGEYEQTIALLSTACRMEADAGERVDCYKYLAFSHIALGEENEAERRFVELLSTDPAHELDPELVSPKILRRFDASRRRLADQLYTEGKNAYYLRAFEDASERMRSVLLLEPEDELAREYLQLCEERLSVEEERIALAEVPEEPEPLPAPPPEDKVYRLTSEIQRPVLLERIAPEYPRTALALGTEGTVVLTVVIDESGLIRESRVLRSVNETIDRAAVEAVKQWRYQPASKNGTPVAIHGVVTLNFQLDR